MVWCMPFLFPPVHFSLLVKVKRELNLWSSLMFFPSVCLTLSQESANVTYPVWMSKLDSPSPNGFYAAPASKNR